MSKQAAFAFAVPPVVTVEPDAFMGFVARPLVLGTREPIVAACHARTAAAAERGLRRVLMAYQDYGEHEGEAQE